MPSAMGALWRSNSIPIATLPKLGSGHSTTKRSLPVRGPRPEEFAARAEEFEQILDASSRDFFTTWLETK